MTAAAEAAAYQRDWARGLRERLAGGAPFAFANADTPLEIFHAMGIPVVVNQWWSSVIAAKQLAAGHFDWMAGQGYHPGLSRYSSLPLMAQLRGDSDQMPWGGLPAPSILCARASADEHLRLFGLWAEATGAPLSVISAPAMPAASDWWERAREDWEALYGSDRLDLTVAEIGELIGLCERVTGQRFDPAALAALMDRIDRQERIFADCADMLAAAPRCPMAIPEQIPNVMIPQWHRGSVWALAHAARVRDEIAERVAAGHAVCPRERIRMMWIGAGLWFDTGFYRAFEESHGAVFAWSMYLPFAADGYLRRDFGDPVRALAARVSALNEVLHEPPFAGAWLASQARRFRIDVAVMLVPQSDRFSGQGTRFIARALRAAGVAVVEIEADMVDPRGVDMAALRARVAEALDGMD